MTISTASITSTDDFSPVYVGDTGARFAPQFWEWNDDTNQYEPIPLTDKTIGMKIQNGVTVRDCSDDWVISDEANGLAYRYWKSGDVASAAIWDLYLTLTDGGGKVVHADKRTWEVKYAP